MLIPEADQMKQSLNPRKTFDFIFIAIFLSCAVYAYLGNIIAAQRVHEAANGMETFKIIISIVAAVSIVISLQWPRYFLTEKKLLAKGNRAEAMQYLQANAVCALGFLESVAVFGLLWAIITSEVKHLPYSSGLAMLAMLYLRAQIIGCYDKVESLFPMDK
jgi:hypothetical protein